MGMSPRSTAACLYCGASPLSLPLIPTMDRSFWISAAAVFVLAAAVAYGQSARQATPRISQAP